MKSALFLMVIAGFVQIPSAKADPKYQLYIKMLQRKMKVHEEVGPHGMKVRPGIKVNGTFQQVINHFSKSKKSPTFNQRYFIDSAYAQGLDSPVIYYICGEGTCEGASGTPLVDRIAQKYHAHRVALEHRYYGYSQPFKTLESKNLIYLSMDQAIEDLADFQKSLQKKGYTGKWIVVGGSYPGELAAFYRMKHPELVVGALASSGPVLAKADFFEYDRHVARVAGPECLTVIQKVVADVEERIKDPIQKAEVKAMFKASDVNNDVDFLYNLADMAASAIQYGFRDQFCNAIVKGDHLGKATKAYAEAGSSLFQNVFGMTAFQDAFEGAMSTDPNDYLGFVGMRSWMYQSCTEFGFYQIANTNRAESARSEQISLQYHNEACDRLFGIKTQVNTAATNKKYYDRLFDSKVSHIYFTNGSVDPWSNLSLTPDSPDAHKNPLLKLFLIDGSSHCEDLGSRVSDALKTARDQFDILVSDWLATN